MTLRSDDLDPSFVVYDWEPPVTLNALRERAQSQSANVGNVVQLIGYDLRTPQVKPGDAIELITLWQVTDPQPVRDTGLVLFTHALNAAGDVVGQEDRLDAPTWDWQPGDVIAQLHRFTLPSDVTGSLAIEVGAYKPNDLTRLPVLVNGVTVRRPHSATTRRGSVIKYPTPNIQPQKQWWEWAVLAMILVLAAFLRLYRLDSVPPGLTHDEADTGYFVTSVYHGAPSQVKAPYGYANEPFTMYSGALLMALLGPTDLALRVHSAFFGVLMILLGYLWARLAFNTPTAIGAAALTAVSFWPIATSRFALNPQPAPALFAGAMWFLWLALFDDRPPRSRWWAWLLFALLLAGSLWAYEVARATTVAIIAFGILIALTDRVRAQRRGIWFMAALALGLVLAAPHLLDADAWQRSATLATTLNDLKTGDLRPLLTTSIETLRTFTFQGDPFITYNVPGRPIFDPLVGILFYGGVLLCLWRWRKPAYVFTLLWISTGILPSMIVGAWNSTLHSMGMQSVVFVPPALFAVEVSRWLGRRYGLRARPPGWRRFCWSGRSHLRVHFSRLFPALGRVA